MGQFNFGLSCDASNGPSRLGTFDLVESSECEEACRLFVVKFEVVFVSSSSLHGVNKSSRMLSGITSPIVFSIDSRGLRDIVMLLKNQTVNRK